jgi:hypothetical protein
MALSGLGVRELSELDGPARTEAPRRFAAVE